MNLRWMKEARPLVWPWCVAGVGMAIPMFPDPGPLETSLGYCLLMGSVATMAALPFGTEFQHRTWSLMLSQPVERARIWREKLNALALPLVTLWLLYWRLAVFAQEPSLLQFALGANFLLASICAALIGFAPPAGGVGRAWLCVGSLPLVLALVSWAVWTFSSGFVSGWIIDKIALLTWTGLVYVVAIFYLGWDFWRRKQLAVWSGLFVLFWAACLSQQDNMTLFEVGEVNVPRVLLAATCLLATAGSGCFWTLLARSTIGGVVFNLAAQFFIAVLVMFGAQRVAQESLDMEDTRALGPLVLMGLIYAAGSLWLGKLRFERLESKHWMPGEELWPKKIAPGLLERFALFRCHARGELRNLARKELRLQKPVFTLAALFACGWLAALVLLARDQADMCGVALGLLGATYVPLAVILAGCVSLGEEKALGLAGWHLTLPVSWLRQWLVKLGVSATVCLVLAVGLPWGLMALTPVRVKVAPGELPLSTLVLVGGAAFALSFCAATLFRNTITDVLTTVATLIGLTVMASFGSWVGAHGVGFGLMQLLLPRLDFGVPPGVNENAYDLHLWVAAIPAVAGPLFLSTLQFRQEQAAQGFSWRYPAILAAVVFLVAYSQTVGPAF